jgi:dCMP deaminase
MDTMRPSWDEYFMEMAFVSSKRATCLRTKVGAVLVKDKRILATGYNGAPTGLPHCVETGCLREKLNIPSGQRHELCRGIHAEQNAVIQAAMHGVSIQGATLYATMHPCTVCTKILINAGIARIVYASTYADPLATELLQEAKIRVEVFTKVLTDHLEDLS